MSVTHNQQIKARKKKDRERKNRKVRNLNRNLPAVQYRLDVLRLPSDGLLAEDGFWAEGIKTFRSLAGVNKYKASVEESRRLGHEILPGRIVNKDGKIVANIEGSVIKGVAPDKITDWPKADPDVKA